MLAKDAITNALAVRAGVGVLEKHALRYLADKPECLSSGAQGESLGSLKNMLFAYRGFASKNQN
jgi:hypothetical protein